VCTQTTDSRPAVEVVTVIENRPLSGSVRSLVLKAPRTAGLVRGGQFVQLDIEPGFLTLRRPLSVYGVSGDTIEILYHQVGEGTRRLATKQAGDASMTVIGPLGTPWPVPDGARTALLVGGGIGAAPLGMLATELTARGVETTVLVAAQNAERLVGEDHFAACGADVACATDDGSRGYAGLVTEPLIEMLGTRTFDVAYVCGPEIMQEKVSARLVGHGVQTFVSLERRMACGIGACLSCVLPTVDGQKRVCVEGPVFDAEEVLWDEARASRV